LRIRAIDKVLVYLELVRPFTLIAPAVGVLSGATIAIGAIPDPRCLIAALSSAILNAASNVNNQYFDLEIDRINKPFRPLPSKRISRIGAVIFAAALYLGAVVLSRLVNIQFFAIVLITAAITFLYSAPVSGIRKAPFISNIFIAIPRGMLLIVAGWSVYRPVSTVEPWFIGGIFALYLMGAATTKDFSDMEGDKRYGIRTLPVVYGPEKAAKIIAPFLYMPFLLIPAGIMLKALRVKTLPLALLSIWGLYTAKLIIRKPRELTFEKNHISWKHMYFLLAAGQLGFAIAYLIKI